MGVAPRCYHTDQAWSLEASLTWVCLGCCLCCSYNNDNDNEDNDDDKDDDDNNNNNNERISKEPFHVKHAQLC